MDEQLRGILADVGGLAVPAAGLAADQDLYAAGLTSFATVSVMLAVEEAFAIEFPDALLKRETFASITALRRTIETLRGSGLAA